MMESYVGEELDDLVKIALCIFGLVWFGLLVYDGFT